MSIAMLIERASRCGCRVHPPAGSPVVPNCLEIPPDLALFYELCGGVDLYPGADYTVSLVAPRDCQPTNVVMLGEQFLDDITTTWYTIGRTPDTDYLSIDLSPSRRGRCYDSFHEIHGVAGSCPVIARTFTELFERLVEGRGGHWYWLQPDFIALGDAYD